jgi:tRNA threonylcarbamoyl adenosine modification protein YeaZ
LKFLLINSNPENAFVAISNGNRFTVSYASEFMSDVEQQNSIMSPDKLIQCFENIAGHSGDLKSVDGISVTTGPGSFTGIRVGLAIAKGAAASLEKKIISIDNFELNYNRAKETSVDITYCVLLPAKLLEYYYALYRNGTLEEIGILQKSEIYSKIDRNTLVVGNFSDDSKEKDSYFKVLKTNKLKPELESMIELSEKKFSQNLLFNPEDVKPVYIKDFVVKSSIV